MPAKKKNKGGRPTKLTEKTLDKLRQAFSIDATVEEACFYASISEDVYYKWKRENQELIKELEQLRKKPILKARQEVVNGLKGFDNSLRYLERKCKKEFSPRTEHTGADGGAIEINTEKKEKIKKALNDL